MSGDTLVTRGSLKDSLFSDPKGSTDEIELQVNPSAIITKPLFNIKFEI
jgi:hypothetical protein